MSVNVHQDNKHTIWSFFMQKSILFLRYSMIYYNRLRRMFGEADKTFYISMFLIKLKLPLCFIQKQHFFCRLR